MLYRNSELDLITIKILNFNFKLTQIDVLSSDV